MNLCDPKTLKALLKKHEFNNTKALGQNFLIDPSVPAKMCEMTGIGAGCGVVEIGPGAGSLSVELAARADRLLCIELDDRLKPVLDETLGGFSNAGVIFADALEVDYAKLAEERLGGLRLFACANLPYNITTKAVMRLLEAEIFEAVTVMVQKEAAARFCAGPGDKNYVAVTAITNFYARPEVLFDVPPSSFLPNPHVHSSVIKFTKHEEFPVLDRKLLIRVIQAAFNNRRKTLFNTLSGGLGLKRDELHDILGKIGIDGGDRGETLSISDFCRIADAIFHSRAQNP